MNRQINAKAFEDYLKKEELNDLFKIKIHEKSIVFTCNENIKSQSVLETIEFYDNTIYLEMYFTSVAEVDVQKRYEILEVINKFNCENYRKVLTIDEDNDLNLTFSDYHGEIELSPDWVLERFLELENKVEEIIPQIMKVIWS
ncbi:MAG: hypothetical protein ACRDCC_10555 [Culicoidibacterales bacterium]